MAALCHDVTHAFFASYVHSVDFAKLRDANVPLFENFLVAIDTVASKTLQRVVLHTGGKVSKMRGKQCGLFGLFSVMDAF